MMKAVIFMALFFAAGSTVAETIDEAEEQALTLFAGLRQEYSENAQALRLLLKCRASVLDLANSLSLYEEPWDPALHQAIIDAIKSSAAECAARARLMDHL